MFPKPYTVIHIPVADITEDAMGNDVRVFGEPAELKSYGWRDRVVESLDGHTSRSVDSIDLALPETPVSLVDRFVVNGKLYEVVGERDHTHGWHGWKPGIVVQLKRVTG